MPLTTSSSVRQLSDGNAVGTVLGQSPADFLGFYGVATPIVQPSQANQGAISQGQAAGVAFQQGSSQSPVTVAPSTSAEQQLATLVAATCTIKTATTDLVAVNKPTAQAGLGVGNPHVTTANAVTVNYSNFTTASIAPTGSEVYGVATLRGWPTLTATLTPAAVSANSTVEQVFTVTGINAGDLVLVNKPTNQAGLDIVGYRAAGANQLGITFTNTTSSTTPITPTAAESYLVSSITGGVDAVSPDVIYGFNAANVVSVAGSTAAEQSLTGATGTAVTDVYVGISKPAAQAGLGIVGGRVSSANTLSLTFGNFTAATIVPTTTEVYMVTTKKPQPPAPLVIYKQALSPTTVAANTTAVQTFTVSGLLANGVCVVNKPAAQVGLGIAGVFCSAANTLSIVYSNSTTVSITPNQAETYIIGQFQVAGAGVTSTLTQAQPINPVIQKHSTNLNAVRNALVNLGVIAGA